MLAPDERYGLLLVPNNDTVSCWPQMSDMVSCSLLGCLIFSYEVGIIHIQLTGFIHKCLPEQGLTIPEHSVVNISMLIILRFDRRGLYFCASLYCRSLLLHIYIFKCCGPKPVNDTPSLYLDL